MKIIPLKYDFCVKKVMENETERKHFISIEIQLKNQPYLGELERADSILSCKNVYRRFAAW